MKIKYIADDGTEFDDQRSCAHYEHSVLKHQLTVYAREIESWPNGKLRRKALEYSKWLRDKQNYPATDSGEHHCCDLMNEMAKRLL